MHFRKNRGASSIDVILNIIINVVRMPGSPMYSKSIERALGMQIDILLDEMSEVVGLKRDPFCRSTSNL